MPEYALFDALLDAPAPDGDWITRTGKIFACGEYPDKAFSLTPTEADAAIAAFTPVAGDLEHAPTVLDGKLGQLTRVWREGADLFGTVTVPAWLDRQLDGTGRRVSLAWDRAAKQIVGWGWVRHPRVSDAALMSAYVAFAGSRHSAADLADLQTIHDLAAGQGATCTPAAPPPKEARMSFVDTVRAWFDAGMPPNFTPDAPPPVVEPPAPHINTSAAAFSSAALDAERAQLAADKAAFRRDQCWTQAETLVSRLITEGRVAPAENQLNADGKPALVALFAQLAEDDATSVATFTGAGTTRLAALQASLAQRPVSAMFADTTPVQLLGNDPAPDATAQAADRKIRLLNKSRLGQQALKTAGKEQ